jgi:hypothetical protein
MSAGRRDTFEAAPARSHCLNDFIFLSSSSLELYHTSPSPQNPLPLIVHHGEGLSAAHNA